MIRSLIGSGETEHFPLRAISTMRTPPGPAEMEPAPCPPKIAER
jgi:hypothetical protein